MKISLKKYVTLIDIYSSKQTNKQQPNYKWTETFLMQNKAINKQNLSNSINFIKKKIYILSLSRYF